MRHKKTKKRTIEPDTNYKNILVAKFINSLMKDGKKSIAQKIFYGAFELIEKNNEEALQVFDRAIQNVGPKQEVKARRVGGASYQVPMEIRSDRRTTLAVRWIIEASKKRSSKQFHTFSEKLAQEILDASRNQGEAVRKRTTIEKMAETNRAFSHFRW